MPFNTNLLVTDQISGPSASFASTFAVHTVLGTVPIILHGTKE